MSKNKIINFVGRIFKGTSNVVKGEVKEILELKPTSEDEAQAEKMANIAVAALAALGYNTGTVGLRVFTRVFAYGIRDIKDGIETPDKLIYKRILAEFGRD